MANRFAKEKKPITAVGPIDDSIQYNWDKWRILGLNPEEIAYLRDKVGIGNNLITALSEGFPELDLNSLGIKNVTDHFSGLSRYDLSKHNNSIYEALGAIYGNLVDQQTKRMVEDRRTQLENQKYQRPFTSIFDYNYPNTIQTAQDNFNALSAATQDAIKQGYMVNTLSREENGRIAKNYWDLVSKGAFKI